MFTLNEYSRIAGVTGPRIAGDSGHHAVPVQLEYGMEGDKVRVAHRIRGHALDRADGHIDAQDRRRWRGAADEGGTFPNE